MPFVGSGSLVIERGCKVVRLPVRKRQAGTRGARPGQSPAITFTFANHRLPVGVKGLGRVPSGNGHAASSEIHIVLVTADCDNGLVINTTAVVVVDQLLLNARFECLTWLRQ